MAAFNVHMKHLINARACATLFVPARSSVMYRNFRSTHTTATILSPTVGERKSAVHVHAVPLLSLRGYRSTCSVWKPSKSKKSAGVGGKKGGRGSNDDDDDVEVELPEIADAEKKMDRQINFLQEELSKLKIGKAASNMFDGIEVPGFGLLPTCGQVVLKSPTKVIVKVFDASMVGAVADAIRSCSLGLNPSAEGSTLQVDVPKPSKETREAMAKNCSKLVEKTKTTLRQVRKVFLDDVKKCKGAVSEDDIKKLSKQVDALTEKKVVAASQALKDKEKELLST